MSVVGGVECVTAELVNSLAEDYEVHVLSLCLTGNLAYNLDSRVSFVCMSDSDMRLRSMLKQGIPFISKYIKQNNIDVVFCQGNYPAFISCLARFLVKAKFVFCDHGALMNQWTQKDIVFMRSVAAHICHKTITLTEQSRKDYIDRFHIRRKKVQSIMNWVDLNRFHSSVYDSESKKVISAGRLGKEKGFDNLIKAFSTVAEKHPDWCLDIYGDGEMFEVCKNLIGEYSLENNIHLMGMSRNLDELYKQYSMYVLPSYREGLPLVLLEAKANKLPIVSFDIMTGPREIIRDGVDGILVEPYDLDKLSNAICYLIENIDVRKSMSDNSISNISKFSKDSIRAQWVELIDSI